MLGFRALKYRLLLLLALAGFAVQIGVFECCKTLGRLCESRGEAEFGAWLLNVHDVGVVVKLGALIVVRFKIGAGGNCEGEACLNCARALLSVAAGAVKFNCV